MKPVIAAKAKERQAEYHGNQYESGLSEISREVQTSESVHQEQSTPKRENRTDAQIAQAAGVSENTIRKVEKIEAQASPEIKAALRTGDFRSQWKRALCHHGVGASSSFGFGFTGVGSSTGSTGGALPNFLTAGIWVFSLALPLTLLFAVAFGI